RNADIEFRDQPDSADIFAAFDLAHEKEVIAVWIQRSFEKGAHVAKGFLLGVGLAQREGVDEVILILPGDRLHEILHIGFMGNRYEIYIHVALPSLSSWVEPARSTRPGKNARRPPRAVATSHKHWIECAYVSNETVIARF